MKTKISISFHASQLPDGVATILGPAGCGADVADVVDGTLYDERRSSAWLKLDEGDPRIAKVLHLLEHYGIESKSFTFDEYSDEDLQSAPLLWMRRDINENVDAGHKYGTKYDMTDACPNCAAGARQTSAFYIDGDDGPAMIRKHRAIGTWGGNILVDGGMEKKLKDAGVTGISFGEVRARLLNKKWSMVARDQILIAHTMPPMRTDIANEDPEYLCKVCLRGGRTHVPTTRYREEDLVGMQDFNWTWEWFGQFWPKPKEKHSYAKWPSPQVLVTPKVMNIFRDAGVKTFSWTPVFIDE